MGDRDVAIRAAAASAVEDDSKTRYSERSMAQPEASELDRTSPPFDRFTSIRWLSPAQRGGSAEHARHHLLVGRDKAARVDLLIKLSAKPGLVYQRDLLNEAASLAAINRALPASRSFPFLDAQGQLPDGRVYLITSLFTELPLATIIGAERVPGRLVAHLRTSITVASALAELHRVPIVHVDLNPMNILYRAEKGSPVIRIVDFESSYDPSRHAGGEFYGPPLTAGYCAPEVSHQAPDARADLFSLGAVLYTLVAGYEWTWRDEVATAIAADTALDAELRDVLQRATAADPGQRYPTAEAMQVALAGYLERIWPGRPW
jgi:serine/threonine protein kinase